MRNRLTLIISFILSLCSLSVSARTNVVQNEMKGESVTRIFKDSRGYMWLGTDNGLAFYDGTMVVHLKADDCTRPHNYVNDIIEMENGRILVGMRHGLYVVDFPAKMCKRVCGELDAVNALVKGDDGTLYAGGEQGFAHISSDASRVLTVNKVDKSNVSSSDNAILCVDKAKDGTMWMCAKNGKVVHFIGDDKPMKVYEIPSELLFSNIGSVRLVADTLFVATRNNGLLKFDTKTHATVQDPRVWVSVKQLQACGDTLYIASDGGGAYSLCKGRLQHLSSTNNSVYSCFIDKQNNTSWFGYYQYGFSVESHAPSAFNVYKYKDFSTENLYVRSFCKRGKQVVIGTRNGLYVVDEERDVVRYFSPQEIGGAIITDIKFFAGRYVVANYEQGLYTLDPVTMELSKLVFGNIHPNASISRVVVSPQGDRMYVASTAGVFVVDEGLQIIESYTDQHSDLLASYIYDIALDKSGKLWISTSSGLCILNPKTKRIQSSHFPEGFINNVANIVFNFTAQGDILAASEQSLFHCSQDLSLCKECLVYEQLGIGQIGFVHPFENGYLMGTDCGLFYSTDFVNFCQFGKHDNLPSSRFSRASCLVDDEGAIWMANAKGLVFIRKEDYKVLLAKVDAKVVFNGYTLDSQDFECNPFDEGRVRISLPWNFTSGELSLSPFMLDYGAMPSEDYFEWSIDGGEKQVCFSERPISLSNLFLGRHKLTVCLAGHPETETELEIVVCPSFMFYVEMFFTIAAIVLMVMYLRLLNRRRQLRELIHQKHQMELQLASANAVSQHIRQNEELRAKEEEQKKHDKEEQLKMRSQNYKELARQVKKYMEKECPYLRSNLRISEVAQQVGTNATTLSQMFNDYLHTNYFDYVNHYRIKHFKHLATDPQYAQFTVLAISEMCGFKRSSFFNVFKKFEGCTPTEWLKKAMDEDSPESK